MRFSGSTNGNAATVAGRVPRGSASSTVVPCAMCEAGTHANPTLRSSRGDQAPAVTRPDPFAPRRVDRPDVVQRTFVGHRFAADVDADELAIDARLRQRASAAFPMKSASCSNSTNFSRPLMWNGVSSTRMSLP